MSMTSVSDEIDNWDIVIGDIATNKLARVRESIVSINVSYSTINRWENLRFLPSNTMMEEIESL